MSKHVTIIVIESWGQDKRLIVETPDSEVWLWPYMRPKVGFRYDCMVTATHPILGYSDIEDDRRVAWLEEMKLGCRRDGNVIYAY